MNRSFLYALAVAIMGITGYSFAEDAHGCYDRQMEAVERYGQSAPLYYWYPRCLPGGYFQNVQCNAFDGCHCSYIDTGEKIPGTLSNLFLRFMRENCPLMPEKKPSPCMEPRKQYPCKSRSSRFYYNSATGECEMSTSSCLGFETKEDCSKSCVVSKRDKCSFRMALGSSCTRRSPEIRWYHESKTGECVRFLFRGCGGNSNNYPEKWSCLKSCENDDIVELLVKVEQHKYFVSLPSWVVEKKQYDNTTVTALTVEEFKEIEEYLVKISKVDESEEPDKSTYPAYENYRPEHANKSISRDEICSMKPEPGPCRALVPSWYFDKEQSKCVRFGYGGCFGNENRHKYAIYCATFCNAKIKPSEGDLFQDLLHGAGEEALVDLPSADGNYEEEEEEEDGNARDLDTSGPAPPGVDDGDVGGEAEIEFSFGFDEDEETTAETPVTTTTADDSLKASS